MVYWWFNGSDGPILARMTELFESVWREHNLDEKKKGIT